MISMKLQRHVFFQRFAIDNIHIVGERGHLCSFTMNIYSGNVVSKDVLKSFHNLLQSGDRTSAKKLVEDLDILWASEDGNVDLSQWSKDDIDNKYFAGKSMALTVTNSS